MRFPSGIMLESFLRTIVGPPSPSCSARCLLLSPHLDRPLGHRPLEAKLEGVVVRVDVLVPVEQHTQHLLLLLLLNYRMLAQVFHHPGDRSHNALRSQVKTDEIQITTKRLSEE